MRKSHSLIIERLFRRCLSLGQLRRFISTSMRFDGQTMRLGVVAIFLLALGLSSFLISARADDAPFITGIVRSNSSICLISYTNCSDTNFDYLVQSSTNLADWTGSAAVQGVATNTTVVCSVVELGKQYFHRVVMVPHSNGPLAGIIAATNNIHMNGSNVIVDSFSPSGTNYNTGTNTYPTNLFTGSGYIYGTIHTGPNSSTNTLSVSAPGSVQ